MHKVVYSMVNIITPLCIHSIHKSTSRFSMLAAYTVWMTIFLHALFASWAAPSVVLSLCWTRPRLTYHVVWRGVAPWTGWLVPGLGLQWVFFSSLFWPSISQRTSCWNQGFHARYAVIWLRHGTVFFFLAGFCQASINKSLGSVFLHVHHGLSLVTASVCCTLKGCLLFDYFYMRQSSKLFQPGMQMLSLHFYWWWIPYIFTRSWGFVGDFFFFFSLADIPCVDGLGAERRPSLWTV